MVSLLPELVTDYTVFVDSKPTLGLNRKLYMIVKGPPNINIGVLNKLIAEKLDLMTKEINLKIMEFELFNGKQILGHNVNWDDCLYDRVIVLVKKTIPITTATATAQASSPEEYKSSDTTKKVKD